jgi:hypothetical protein
MPFKTTSFNIPRRDYPPLVLCFLRGEIAHLSLNYTYKSQVYHLFVLSPDYRQPILQLIGKIHLIAHDLPPGTA